MGTYRNRLAHAMERLAFLRHNVREMLLWPLLGIFLIAAIWWLALARIHSDRDETAIAALRDATRLANSYATQLFRSIDHIDQITHTVQYYWHATHGALNLEEQWQQGLYSRSAKLSVSIYDRTGTIVTSTVDKANAATIADTDYFKAQQLNADKGLLINQPAIGHRDQKGLIRFTRRLMAANGAFDGIVVVAVEPSYLVSFGDEASLGRHGSLAVWDNDGVVAAAGAHTEPLPSIFRSASGLASPDGSVRMPKETFGDRQARIVAWQKTNDYPLVAMVALSEADVFSAFQARADSHRTFAWVRSVFVLLFAMLAVLLSVRIAWKRYQADEVQNTYRLAIDGAREGFYMVRALYDQCQNVVDFMFEDCNERGAVLAGYPKEELVGKRFFQLYSGEDAHRIFVIFRDAMALGYYEDEFQPSPHCPPHVTWMSRKLVRSGSGLAVTVRDMSDTKANEHALLSMANMDALTSLPNRRWLINFLPAALKQASSSGTILALLFIDLDEFKTINDTSGHHAGDAVLQAAAGRLQSVLRPADRVVRLGGDEFTVLLHAIASQDEAAQVAMRINAAFREPFVVSGCRHVVGASIGISLFPRDGIDAETLLQHADMAMYSAKADGAGQFRFYARQDGERVHTRPGNEPECAGALEEN